MTIAGDVADTVGAAVCSAVPPPVRDAMAFVNRSPWRQILSAAPAATASYAPLVAIPLTLPLALFQVPIFIAASQARFVVQLIGNCFQVTETVRQQACDARAALDLANQFPLRQVLELAPGAEPVRDFFRVVRGPANAVLGPACRGQPPDLAAVAQLALTLATASGDPEFLRIVQRLISDAESLDREAREIAERVGIRTAEGSRTRLQSFGAGRIVRDRAEAGRRAAAGPRRQLKQRAPLTVDGGPTKTPAPPSAPTEGGGFAVPVGLGLALLLL